MRAGRIVYILLLAISASGADSPEQIALRSLHQAIENAADAGQALPPNLEQGLSWLLNDSAENQPQISLPAEGIVPSKEMVDAWANWIMVTAGVVIKAGGDRQRAATVLSNGLRMLPGNEQLNRALAACLVNLGESQRALDVYKSWGLKNATAAEYAQAITAAISAHDKVVAATWLKEALAKWPHNPNLLDLAAIEADLEGDHRRGKIYRQEALHALVGAK